MSTGTQPEGFSQSNLNTSSAITDVHLLLAPFRVVEIVVEKRWKELPNEVRVASLFYQEKFLRSIWQEGSGIDYKTILPSLNKNLTLVYAVIQEVATDEQIEAISDDLPYIPPSDHTIDWVVLFSLFKGLHEESVKRINVPEAVLPKIIDSIYIAFTKLLQYCAVEGVSYDSAIAEEGFFFVFEQVDEWNGLIALAWDKTIADDAYPLHQVVESRRRLQDLKNTVNVSRIPSLIPEWLQHGDRGDVLNALNKTIERLKEHEEVKREQKSQPAPQPEPVKDTSSKRASKRPRARPFADFTQKLRGGFNQADLDELLIHVGMKNKAGETVAFFSYLMHDVIDALIKEEYFEGGNREYDQKALSRYLGIEEARTAAGYGKKSGFLESYCGRGGNSYY